MKDVLKAIVARVVDLCRYCGDRETCSKCTALKELVEALPDEKP